MEGGKYVWTPDKLPIAHNKCQAKCENLMKLQFSRVVVANTSTRERDLIPYYDLAKKYNYNVFSVIVENRHNGVNSHNVPEESLRKMKENFSIKLI